MQMSQNNVLLRLKAWQKLKTRQSQGNGENEMIYSSHFGGLRK
jgi:hypothetical protein